MSVSCTNKHNVYGRPLIRGDVEAVFKNVDPTSADINYHVPTVWINQMTNEVFLLIEIVNHVATWLNFMFQSSPVISSLPIALTQQTTTLISKYLHGAFASIITNMISGGPCHLNCIARNDPTSVAQINSIVSSAGAPVTNIVLTWTNDVQINKDSNNFDGTYQNLFMAPMYVSSSVALSGVAYSAIFRNNSGNLLITISNDIAGPVALYALSKSESTKSASIFKLASSPSATLNDINIRWLVSSSIDIAKSLASNDGTYTYFDAFSVANFIPENNETVALSGVTWATAKKIYHRFCGFIAVKNLILNGPSAIFAISKNLLTNTPSLVRVTSAPATTSLEELELRWNASTFLEMRKSGVNYDGNYQVTLMDDLMP